MLSRVRRGSLLAIAASCSAVVLTAGCGSSDDDGGSTTSAAKPTTSTPAASGAKATGKPLKVLITSFIDSPVGSVPEVYAGGEVAAENINKAGGINGRPLEVIRCNGKSDAKAEQACARQAVSQGAIATVENVSVADAAGVMEILDRASIASIALPAASPVQNTIRTAFPIEYYPGLTTGCVAPAALDRVGDAKIGLLVGQNPIAEGEAANLTKVINADPSVKARYAGSVSVPVTAQDLSPFIQDLDSKGAEYIINLLDPAAIGRSITAAAAAGKKWSYCADPGTLGANALTKLGPLTKNIMLSPAYPPPATGDKFPLVKQFVDEMAAAKEAGNKDADLNINYVNSARSWFGMQVVAQVAKSMKGDITAKSFLEALSKATVDLDYAQLDFTKPLGTPPYERVFQPKGFLAAWNNETKELDPLGEVNLLDPSKGEG